MLKDKHTNKIVLALKLVQANLQIVSKLERLLLNSFLLDNLQDCFADSARDRVTAKGVEVNSVGQTLGDFGCGSYSCQRRTVTNTLEHQVSLINLM